jgi:hypothetical protein
MHLQPSDDERFLALTRRDLVASVNAFRLATQSRRAWAPVAGAVASLLGGALGATAASVLGWPGFMEPAFFLTGLGGSLILTVTTVLQHRKVVARTQWECPSCSAPMIAASGLNPLARAEMAIASGRCPSCAFPLFDEERADEPGA